MSEILLLNSPPVALLPEEEAQVIEDAKNDPHAFARLYRMYVHPIYRYLYSRSGQVSIAEDLTTQVFIEALESLTRYRHQGRFLAWLFAIARHRVLNYYHRSPRETTLDSAWDRPGSDPDPLAQVIQNEEVDTLLRLIGQLKEEERDLLRLRFVAELSFAEIAKLLNHSEGAVKKQTYRLLARLESQMEDRHE